MNPLTVNEGQLGNQSDVVKSNWRHLLFISEICQANVYGSVLSIRSLALMEYCKRIVVCFRCVLIFLFLKTIGGYYDTPDHMYCAKHAIDINVENGVSDDIDTMRKLVKSMKIAMTKQALCIHKCYVC